MKQGVARRAGPLIAFAFVLVGAGTANASTLDPFRPSGKTSPALNPFRAVAQAADPAPAAAPAPAPAPAAKGCQKDEDCPENNICEANACQPIELSTNALLYWSRKGPTGHRVVVPFYWHFWSPTSKSRIVAPFYWRFDDFSIQRKLTVVWLGLAVSWSRQPDARSFGLWPLFYTSNKFGWAIPPLVTFKIADPDAGKSFGAVLMLYWWRRAPDGAFDMLVPLFAAKRSAASAFTYVLPLNFYWRTNDNASLLALPFFYQNFHKKGSSFYTWLGYTQRAGSERTGSIAWLYWFKRDKKERDAYDVFFPLVWSFRGPTSNTTVVGPFLHLARDTHHFTVGFPLWWSGGDKVTGQGFRLFIPLFYWHRGPGGKTSTVVTAFGGYRRDDDAGTKTFFAWPILSLYRRDKESQFRFFTPLYVSHWSRSNHSTTRLISLLFYQRQDLEGSTTVLFPLLWRFRDAATQATATTIFPLFFHRSGPRDSTTIATLLYWRSFVNGGWSAGLLPLAFFGSNAGRGHGVVFPLFWHFRAGDSSTTVLFPLYRHRDKHGYAFGAIPLLFLGSHDGESYAVQFPLVWHFASERNGSATTVTPLGYYRRDRDGWSIGAGPLIPLIFARSGQTRSHFALVPLIWHFSDRAADRTTTVVGPYWHQRWGDETTDALFPLLHYRRGTRPGGKADETSFTLFPLIHYRRDEHTRVLVTPLGGSARGPRRAGGFVGPYIWYDDKDLSARFIPLLYTDVTRHKEQERAFQIGLWFGVDAPKRKSRVLFPLFGHHVDEHERDTWVFPSYFRLRRDNGDRVDALVPVFWRSKFGDRETNIIGPYYDRTRPGVHNTGVVPFFFHASNPERGLTVIPPFLYVHKWDPKGERDWLWCALFYRSRDKESTTTVGFPIYWSRHRGPRHQRFLFPVYWHVANDDERSSWTLAGPFVSSTRGTSRTMGILPLAWFTRDPATGYATNALMPLFYQSHGREHSTFLTLVGGYRRKGLSRLWYALNLWSSDGPNSSFNTFFPLWFTHKNKVTETTTRVIPPLLYVQRTNPEKGYTGFLALFWRKYDVASATTLGLPLFYDINEYELSRTTLFLPLFYRYATPQNITAVGFPLYWDFKRGDNRTTVLFPIYYRWKRPGYTRTLVVPFYFRHEGNNPDGTSDGTYRHFIGVVAPLYDAGVKRPGDFMWEILGGLVGQERVGQHRYMRLFWFRFETGAAPRAQTAWYSQPARTPRRTVARGLNVAGF
jgi:hypothetical protein